MCKSKTKTEHSQMSKVKKIFRFVSKQASTKRETGMPEKYFRNPFDDYTKETAKELIENNLVTKKYSLTLCGGIYKFMLQVSPKCKISCSLNAKWQATINKCQCLDYNDYSVYTGTSGIALLKLKKDPENVESLQVKFRQ